MSNIAVTFPLTITSLSRARFSYSKANPGDPNGDYVV